MGSSLRPRGARGMRRKTNPVGRHARMSMGEKHAGRGRTLAPHAARGDWGGARLGACPQTRLHHPYTSRLTVLVAFTYTRMKICGSTASRAEDAANPLDPAQSSAFSPQDLRRRSPVDALPVVPVVNLINRLTQQRTGATTANNPSANSVTGPAAPDWLRAPSHLPAGRRSLMLTSHPTAANSPTTSNATNRPRTLQASTGNGTRLDSV